MFSKQSFVLHVDEENEALPSFVELIRFLKLYLDFETTNSIEHWANRHVRDPDGDTKSFVKFVKSEIDKKLMRDREYFEMAIEKIISDYRNKVRNSENQIPSRDSSIDSLEPVTVEAGKKLIEDLEAIIPEPRRSTFKEKTLNLKQEFLDDYVNDLREQLSSYIEDREQEIQLRLHIILDNFGDDLLTLSRQRRVVSKIDLLVKELEKQDVSEEDKANIYNIAEPVKKTLNQAKFTPALVHNISELIRRANILAENRTSRNFKKAVKELGDTVNYLFR